MSLPVLATAAAAFTALLMLRAGWSKLRHAGHFGALIAAYELLPAALSRRLARPLGGFEFLGGIALLVPSTRACAAVIAMALLGAYAVAMSLALLGGKAGVDCGCGPLRYRQPLSGWLVLRNAALALVAAPVVAGGAALPAGPAAWSWTALIVVAALALNECVDLLLARDALLADD